MINNGKITLGTIEFINFEKNLEFLKYFKKIMYKMTTNPFELKTIEIFSEKEVDKEDFNSIERKENLICDFEGASWPTFEMTAKKYFKYFEDNIEKESELKYLVDNFEKYDLKLKLNYTEMDTDENIILQGFFIIKPFLNEKSELKTKVLDDFEEEFHLNYSLLIELESKFENRFMNLKKIAYCDDSELPDFILTIVKEGPYKFSEEKISGEKFYLINDPNSLREKLKELIFFDNRIFLNETGQFIEYEENEEEIL